MPIVEILILCRVVDNYGDIGFVYRLARALSALDPSLRLALAVSDLTAFSYMAPGLDASKAFQRYCGWDVLDWNAAEQCAAWCRSHGVRLVIECFQCGRPDWLDAYLFGGGLPEGQTARIINLEYLTAEDWAEDFHLLKSGTRSASVKKVNFMPGFTPRTGGLLLERGFMDLLAGRETARERIRRQLAGQAGGLAGQSGLPDPSACNILVFSYEKDFTPLVRALERFHAEGGKPVVYLAPGRGAASFKAACTECAAAGASGAAGTAGRTAGAPFPLVELPRLDQELWDALLVSCDVAFVRGEESFARACLASRPFLWQAYRQDGAFHLVKVAALLERMRDFFAPDDFSLLAELFLLYNIDNSDAGIDAGKAAGAAAAGGSAAADSAEAAEAVAALCPGLLPHLAESGWQDRRLAELAFRFLREGEHLAPCFAAFSASLIANGDLAAHLLACLREKCG